METEMKDVLVAAEVVCMTTKDLHYRAHDEWFYALHLLADKVDGLQWKCDALKEAYWLGEHMMLPPSETILKAEAAERGAEYGIDNRISNRALVDAVMRAASAGIDSVEAAKKEEGLKGGVHAILDEISKTFLVARGLCWRTLAHGISDGKKEDGSGEQLAKYLEIVAAK